MVWFKVDDGFWAHPKVLELGDEAVALWVRAGSYCAAQLTDGKVSMRALRMLLADHDAQVELVNAGLWDYDENGKCYWFHDWSEYQPTREQVLAERAAATERKRVSREKSRQKSQGESRRDAQGMDAVIPRSPTRPDPTRPDPLSSTPPGIEERDAQALLSPFCSKHPEGTDGPCRPCGVARMRFETAKAAEKNKPSPRIEKPAECAEHPGWPLPCDKCAAIAAEQAVA